MENRKFKATRRMIMSRVLLVPFLAVMLVFGTLVYYFATNLRSQAKEKLTHLADGHRHIVEQFLNERVSDLRYVAISDRFENLKDNDHLAQVLDRLQGQSRAFFDIGVFDDAGNHVAYIGPYDLRGRNYADAEWFLKVKDAGIYISDVFLGYRNIPHFVIAVRGGQDGAPWYLRATIDTLFFNDLVENLRIGKTGEAYLVNEQGVFQTRRRSGGNLMEVDRDFERYVVAEEGVASFASDDGAGSRHVYATCRLASTGWLLVVRQELGDAYAPLTRAVLLAVALIIAGGAVVVTMGFLLASGVANQLTVADMEKKRMGSQLIMAGKLAEVGEMSAGLAHEINNPLQVMKSEEALALDILDDMEQQKGSQSENMNMLRDSIIRMGAQVDRCKKITLGLLKFARQSETSIQKFDMPPLLHEVVGMVDRRARVENIQIVEELGPDLPRIESDPAQLQQVFLNLLNNAIDALKGRDNGQIKVGAVVSNGHLSVSFADNGCGIPPENLEKIFLPFFTTKPVGQGTGLGLSTCYGIVERLGGQISVSSEVNVGTVFTVRLPLSAVPERAQVRHAIRQEQGG